MSNLLTNPGFESGATGWTLNENAMVLSTYPARTGTYVCELRHSFTPNVAADAQRTVTLVPGAMYLLTCWVRFIAGASTMVLALDCSPGGGTGQAATLASISATGDWQKMAVAVVVDGDGTCLVDAYGLPQNFSVANQTWIIDDFVLERVGGVPVARHLHTAYADLVTQLLTINGAAGGYYHDLGSRVYCRLLTPHDASSAFPFLSVFVSTPPRFSFTDASIVKATLTISIVGFINESVALDAANSATTPALKLIEDVTRALMPATGGQWDFGSATVDDMRLVPQQVVVGVADGYEFAEVPIDVELDIRFARADLGPTA